MEKNNILLFLLRVLPYLIRKVCKTESPQNVLFNPSKMLKDTEFEILLSLSSEAYYIKKGKEFEYESGCSYETFSNKEGWSNTL